VDNRGRFGTVFVMYQSATLFQTRQLFDQRQTAEAFLPAVLALGPAGAIQEMDLRVPEQGTARDVTRRNILGLSKATHGQWDRYFVGVPAQTECGFTNCWAAIISS